MKAIDTTAYLLCAGAILFGAAALPAPQADAQSAQGQSQTGQNQAQNDRVHQLQSQPPKINTEQEWKAAVEFMQANCPNRLNFVLELQNRRPLQFDHAKELMLKQYRQISNTKDSDIRDMAIKQAQIQDEVFGALIQYRTAKARNEPRKVLEAQTALHKAENDQVNVQIALRMLRIQKLQVEIDEFNKKRQIYVDNWSKDELKRASTGEFDDANRSGNAAIEDPGTPPTRK